MRSNTKIHLTRCRRFTTPCEYLGFSLLRSVDGQRSLQPEAGNQPAINSNEEQCPLRHLVGLASL